jgi:hypothetical protein
MVAHNCNPSYSRGGDRRIMVQASLGKVSGRSYCKHKMGGKCPQSQLPGKSRKPYLKDELKAKGSCTAHVTEGLT